MNKKYTREILESAVKESKHWGDVTRKIGASTHGGSRDYIKGLCIKYGIDFSHFLGRHWMKGISNKGISFSRKSPDQILINIDNPKYRIPANMLRRAMIESGVEDICSGCGVSKEWNGKPIILEIDHIDGNHGNCTLGNLRFMCPNCHSQTANYKTNGRKFGEDFTARNAEMIESVSKNHIGRTEIRKEDDVIRVKRERHFDDLICPVCHKEFKGESSDHRIYCSYTCHKESLKRFNVSKDELEALVWRYPAKDVAKMFGVSDVAISKRCKSLGIIKPGLGYWTKIKYGMKSEGVRLVEETALKAANV